MTRLKYFFIVSLCASAFGQNADEILDKATDAMGGEEIAEQIDTLAINGHMMIPPGIKAQLKVYQKKGGKILATTTINAQGMNMEVVQGCDGVDCFSKDPHMGLRLLEGQEKEMLLYQNDFMSQLDWKELYPKREYRGNAEVDGKSAHQVYLETPGGMSMLNYFDAENYLLVKSEGDTKNALGNFKFTTRLHDYKDVYKGFKIPMRTVMSMMSQTMELNIDEVEVNIDIPDSKFKIPEGLK